MTMFHFLRPEWLWGLLPVLGLFLLVAKRGTPGRAWEHICDTHLLPHLLAGTEGAKHRLPLVLLGTGWMLAVLALAGPVWSQLPQPVFRTESALVIILDLSRSMDVQDVAPSRLTRAKHKILDMLKLRKEGQTALVVFAGEPFIVSPLTDDAGTMVTLVQSLETNLVPLQGSRADLALRKAGELLRHVGHAGGDLLLMTDGEGDPATLTAAKELRRQGRRVSVLGVGTVEGGPIPEQGGFLKDQEGSIIIPTLDIPSLQEIAGAGGGRYATVSVNDRDIMQVLPSYAAAQGAVTAASEQRTTDVWREEGPWLVLLLLAMALPAFRSGWLGVFVLFLLMPQVSEALSWETFWSRPDQQGVRALERDAPKEAAALFEDPAWKGVAHYRSGDYEEAEAAFSAIDTPEGHYNRGNALARLGRYEEAAASYQAALTQQPDHADARHNLDVLKQFLDTSSSNQEKSSPSSSESSPSRQKSEQVQQENDRAGAGDKGEESVQTSDSPQAQSPPGERSPAGAESDPPASGGQSPLEQEETEKTDEKTEPQEARDPGASKRNDGEQTLPPASSIETEETQPPDSEMPGAAQVASPESPSETQKSDQALQQWLRRIPDDPGGLLRRKFLLEHQRRLEAGKTQAPQTRRW